MLLAALAGLWLGQAPMPDSIMLGVRVVPETVTVGMPFRVIVRVRAPRGARIQFAAEPDSTGTVQALDTRQVVDAPDTAFAEATATYRLAAWDVGRQSIGIPSAVVRMWGAAGAAPVDRELPLGALSVIVRRVGPAPKDTGRRTPRPARPVLTPAEPWWWRYAVGIGAMLLLLLVLWWLARRGGRTPARPADPYVESIEALTRLEHLGLIEAGERGRYVALVTQIVRDYLNGRVAGAGLSLTTGELLDALRDDARVPLVRLRGVLEESDLVKFAQRAVTAERAAAVARDARAVLEETEGAVRAAEAAAQPSGQAA